MAKTLKQKLKYNQKPIYIKVVSGSMEPIIHAGDIVLIEKVDKYIIGNILLYHYKSAFYIHRFIYQKNNKFFLKGDNSRKIDLPINVNQIVGKAVVVYNSENNTVYLCSFFYDLYGYYQIIKLVLKIIFNKITVLLTFDSSSSL
jgi:signal peptidase I